MRADLQLLEALADVPLREARQRPKEGGVGGIHIGDAFQVDNEKAPNGKATIVVRDIYVRYGLGDPETVIVYDYKVGPSVKGQETMSVKRLLAAVGAA